MGLLRVILALSVALAHFGGLFGYTAAGGFAAVQMFYIISGFYMATILGEKYDPRADIRLFYTNRFLRIFATYWAVLLLSLAAYYVIFASGLGGWLKYVLDNAQHVGLLGKLWLIFTNLFIVGQETTLFMRIGAAGLEYSAQPPGGDIPVWLMMPVPQAWTLSLELMFYALVPFLARLRTPRLIAIVAASLALRIAVYSAGYQNDPWLSRFFPHELALFVMGMLARRFYDAYIARIPARAQWGIVIAFFAATLVMRTLIEAVDPAGIEVSAVIWPYYASAIVAVPCLFHLTRHTAWDGKLGNFSYPIYLLHWIVMVFYDAFAPRWGLPVLGGELAWARVLACLTATLALSWMVIVVVEGPIEVVRRGGKPLGKV